MEQKLIHNKSVRLYRIWANMIQRCHNINNPQYKDYGGRNIKVCDSWRNYKDFHHWANNSGYKDSLTLERIDNDSDYSASNCRWATYREQANNKRSNKKLSFDGKVQTVQEWSRDTGINHQTICQRLYAYGWTVEQALTMPIGSRVKAGAVL